MQPLFGYLSLLVTTAGLLTENASGADWNYPAARRTNLVDTYHGVQVADPYRWLEDSGSAETKAWIQAENRLTFSFLEKIPQRPAIRDRLTRLWNFERYSVPSRKHDRYYFFSKNDGLQNQSVLYTLTALDGEPKLLLDPNTLSADGTVALTGTAASDDGQFLAYGLATAGSDWQEWKVREVSTGDDLEDDLKWIKFSGASWGKDGKGFYYSRYDAPAETNRMTRVNEFQKLYYHHLRSPQSRDTLVYSRPDHRDWIFDGSVTDDGHYLIITVQQGTERRNRVYYRDLARPDAPVVELLNDFDAQYAFLDNDGPLFWFQTDLQAPRGHILGIDIRKPERSNWREIVPESTNTLTRVSVLNNSFVCTYLQDAHSQVKVFSLDGRFLHDLPLPGIGSVGGFPGQRQDTGTFYAYTSFTTPGTIYHYDLTSGVSSVFRSPKVDIHPADFETTQVFYSSKDGTRVPMFLTHRKGLALDGSHPTLLYAYGGFGISLTPSFSVATVVWMEMGGIFAVANIRGGGEYGESWHQAGMKLNKQNGFDDFIAAGEWLIAHKYTSTPKLAIAGGSNGGLLVGACETQRPELFGACLPSVGVMDMLRFNQYTIGWAWTSEYGSPANPDEFKALYAYSPLHHVRSGTHYPATFITTADHDDRVVPAHSFKFAAALQAAQAGPAPILIRVETRAGHGAGKPTAKLIDEAADKWAFLAEELKIKLPPGFAMPDSR